MANQPNKQDEVRFLAEEFNLSPVKAAALVTDDEDEALKLAAAERDREQNEDLLGDNPVPFSPEDRAVPDNGGLQKSVLRRRNDRGRAGP